MAGSSPTPGSAGSKQIGRSIWFRVSLSALIAMILIGSLVLFIGERRAHPHASATIASIDGRPVEVRPGETLGQVLRELGVIPKPGRVLDLMGQPIPGRSTPPTILVDGTPAPLSMPIVSGDVVTTSPGADRTEGTVIRRQVVPGWTAGDPQFTVSRWHMVRIAEIGRISGELAGLRFHPVGTGHVSREVALTFDDGPSPTWTPRVLAILARLHVPATFFLIGDEAQRYPGLVHAEARAGMTIGNHSWDHPITPPFDQLPYAQIDREISATDAELAKLGMRPRLFRPPGGTSSPAVIAAAAQNGLRIVLWNVDPRDWEPGVRPNSIVRNVLGNVRVGSIVELHDGGGDRSATIRALPAIIRGIRKMGLGLVAL